MAERLASQVTGRAAAGAAWLVGARLGAKAIDFASLLILARLLGPTEFGLVAVGMTLILIVEAVLELPVNQVLVRLSDIDPRLFDTAFTLSALRGLALAVTLTALAKPFALLYNDPKLFLLIVILGTAPIMRGLQSPRLAEYARLIDFRRDFVIELAGKSVAFLSSVLVAYYTHSYWALVIGTVATPATMLIVSFALAPYRPRFTLFEWRVFAGFLGWTTAAQFVNAINWQCDRLLLGRFVSRARLGEFSLANDLSYLPEQALIKPILRPLMSAFSHVRHDRSRLAQAYSKSAMAVLGLGMPIMLGLCLLAGPAVRLMLGGKWLAAVPVLQWLPLSLIPPLFTSPLGPLAMMLDRTRIFLRQTLLEMAVKLPAVAFGAFFFGVAGVIVARIAAAVVTGMIAMIYVRQLIGTPLRVQIASPWRILVSGALLCCVVAVVRPILDPLTGFFLAISLAGIVALGATVYLVALFGLWHLSGRPDGLESIAFAQIHARARCKGTRRSLAYTILAMSQWTKWQSDGSYSEVAGPLEFSVARDVATVAAREFIGLRDLVLIEIDLRVLGGNVRWEHDKKALPGRNIKIEGPIPLKAVTKALPINPN